MKDLDEVVPPTPVPNSCLPDKFHEIFMSPLLLHVKNLAGEVRVQVPRWRGGPMRCDAGSGLAQRRQEEGGQPSTLAGTMYVCTQWNERHYRKRQPAAQQHPAGSQGQATRRGGVERGGR